MDHSDNISVKKSIFRDDLTYQVILQSFNFLLSAKENIPESNNGKHHHCKSFYNAGCQKLKHGNPLTTARNNPVVADRESGHRPGHLQPDHQKVGMATAGIWLVNQVFTSEPFGSIPR